MAPTMGIHPCTCAFELEMNAVMSHSVPHAQSVSRLHPVERDLAIVVSEDITHDALMACIQQADTTQLLNNATLFDVYRPPNLMLL